MVFSVNTVNTALDPVAGYTDPRLNAQGFFKNERVRYRFETDDTGAETVQRGGMAATYDDVTDTWAISNTDADDIEPVLQVVPRLIQYEIPESDDAKEPVEEEEAERVDEEEPTWLEQILEEARAGGNDLAWDADNQADVSVLESEDMAENARGYATYNRYGDGIEKDRVGSLVDTSV